MLLLHTLTVLSLSFGVLKNEPRFQEPGLDIHTSFSIKNSLFKNIQTRKRISQSGCNFNGDDFDESIVELYYCSSATLVNLNFTIDDDSTAVKIEGSNDTKIMNCRYDSGKDAPVSTIVQIINTEININSFIFDFKNLTRDEYITSPILDLNAQSATFLSQISISVFNSRLGADADDENFGGIIKSHNYKLQITDTIIDTITLNQYASKCFIFDIGHSEDQQVDLSLSNSYFTNTNNANFTIKVTDKLSISNSQFEGFNIDDTNSFFTIEGENLEVIFYNATFSRGTGCPINPTKWKTTENNINTCTFEEIKGTALILGSAKSTIIHSQFLNNTNDKIRTSAIYASGEMTLTITFCNFTGNEGRYIGGAVLIDVPNAEITECFFVENSCKKRSEQIGEKAMGGALYIYQKSSFNLTRCIFTGNHADTEGGALFIQYKVTDGQPNNDYVSVVHCTFEQCTTDGSGGAFSSGIGENNVQCDGDIVIEDCSFIDCKASKYGGALMFQDGTSQGDEEKTIINCTFNHCSANEGGSCIYSRAYIFHCSTTYFQNTEKSEKTPSIIYLEMNENDNERNSPTISDCTFSQNEIDVIYADVKGTLSFNGCTFEDYKSENLLKLCYMNSKGTEEGTIFTNCRIDEKRIGR